MNIKETVNQAGNKIDLDDFLQRLIFCTTWIPL